MPYQYAAGHNNAGGLVTVSIQPASPGLLYPREVNALSGAVYDDGLAYTRWVYGPEITPEQYAALLVEFGLTAARSALCTVHTLVGEDRETFASYNARIIRPRNGASAKWRRPYWRDVEFIIARMEAL